MALEKSVFGTLPDCVLFISASECAVDDENRDERL